MDSEGNIRVLESEEQPQADEVVLTAEEAVIAETMTKKERIGFYKHKRLVEKYGNAVYKITPKSKHRKQPRSVLPKSLRRAKRKAKH